MDHPEHGLRSIEHRAGAQNDLDVIDDLEGHTQATIEIGGAVPGLVEDVSIQQDEDVVAVVAGQQHAASTDLDGVQRRRRDHAQRNEVDGLVERSDAVAAQLLRGHDAGGGGRSGRRLRASRGGGDDGLREQLVQIAGFIRALHAKTRA
jgi:hypothetical protein